MKISFRGNKSVQFGLNLFSHLFNKQRDRVNTGCKKKKKSNKNKNIIKILKIIKIKILKSNQLIGGTTKIELVRRSTHWGPFLIVFYT